MNTTIAIFLVLSISMIAGEDAPQPQAQPPSCQDYQTQCNDFCAKGNGETPRCDKRCTEIAAVCSCSREKCVKPDSPIDPVCTTACQTEHQPNADCDTDYSICIGTCNNVCSLAKDQCIKAQ